MWTRISRLETLVSELLRRIATLEARVAALEQAQSKRWAQ